MNFSYSQVLEFKRILAKNSECIYIFTMPAEDSIFHLMKQRRTKYINF